MKYKQTEENRMLEMIQLILKLQSTHYYWVDLTYYGTSKCLSVYLYRGKRDLSRKPILYREFLMDWVASPTWNEHQKNFEDFLELLEEKYQNVAPPKL